MSDFTQLCVWDACDLGDKTAVDFEKFVEAEFNGTRAKFAEVVTTLPDVKNGKVVEGTGGRHDLLFFIHSGDIEKFAAARLTYGIHWWEDCLANGYDKICPDDVLKRYPPTWGAADGEAVTETEGCACDGPC